MATRHAFFSALALLWTSTCSALLPGYELNLGVYRPSTNQVYAYADLAQKTYVWNFPYGAAGDKPVVGDFDGNGVYDLAVVRQGRWFIDTSHDFIADLTQVHGTDPSDIPLAGDFDGDGRAELVVYRSATGVWYRRNLATGAVVGSAFFVGQPSASDQPVIADFNGDGIADRALYRGGYWFVDLNGDGRVDQTFVLGGDPADKALAFDWDGDGRADFCVFRNGIWYIRTQQTPSVTETYALGGAGDIPLAGGSFDVRNTVFVKAGATGSADGSLARPLASIQQGFDKASAGGIVRVAAGTYAENVGVFGPQVQYAPSLFGKDNVKILGVSRRAVTVAPGTSDALFNRGATGLVLEGMHFAAPAGRGVVLIGGAGSVNPELPGATATIKFCDFAENRDYGVLVTGSSFADIRYSNLSRSKLKSGFGSQSGAPSANLVGNVIAQNGYTLPDPSDGSGIEAQATSRIVATRNLIQNNNRFGIIGINQTSLDVEKNTIEGNRLNGLILCGASPNDQSTAVIVGNWISSNGTQGTQFSGYNGIEFYITCTQSQYVAANTFIKNSLNGIFLGSGTATITGNVFRGNTLGITLSHEAGASAATNAVLYGNTFDSNTYDGVFAGGPLNATIGGIGAGQSNTFLNHSLHAIGCNTGQEQLTCPHAGNSFSGNADTIEASCPSTCTN